MDQQQPLEMLLTDEGSEALGQTAAAAAAARWLLLVKAQLLLDAIDAGQHLIRVCQAEKEI